MINKKFVSSQIGRQTLFSPCFGKTWVSQCAPPRDQEMGGRGGWRCCRELAILEVPLPWPWDVIVRIHLKERLPGFPLDWPRLGRKELGRGGSTFER